MRSSSSWIRPAIISRKLRHAATFSACSLAITGGKWTTYRRMAEDCVNQAATLARLPERPCVTRDLRVHGFIEHAEELGHLAVYGSDAPPIEDLIRGDPTLGER